MRKTVIALALIFGASAAHAATAYWTGASHYVTTVTYKSGISCEYNYAGNKFWRTFTQGYCPSSVEVN